MFQNKIVIEKERKIEKILQKKGKEKELKKISIRDEIMKTIEKKFEIV